MSKSYKVNVNNAFNFEINEESLSNLDVVPVSSTRHHVLSNNTSYAVAINSSNFNNKQYLVKVNNNTYNVLINNELDSLIKQMGFEVGSAKKVNSIKAPMPGLILDINVEIGQEIKEDDTILILEAMKMENIITAPRDGVIKSISAEKGDAVEKNQLLIEFE